MHSSNSLVFALALLSPAEALTPREELAATVNAAKTTWRAFVGSDRDKPLHSSRHLYGVKVSTATSNPTLGSCVVDHYTYTLLRHFAEQDGSRAEFEALTKIPGSGFVMAPKVSAEVAAAIPASFSSAEAWPHCAKVINDIRDQSNCGAFVVFFVPALTNGVLELDPSDGVGVSLSCPACFLDERRLLLGLRRCFGRFRPRLHCHQWHHPGLLAALLSIPSAPHYSPPFDHRLLPILNPTL